jgi:hypothetical protein
MYAKLYDKLERMDVIPFGLARDLINRDRNSVNISAIGEVRFEFISS